MRLFLYGTLMQGGCSSLAAALHERLERGEPATARGRLFALPDPAGWYPALIDDPSGGAVCGFLHETAETFTEADLAALDAYEGADYRREEIPVELGGLTFMAQAWLWQAPLPEGALPIAGGDFRAFLRERGLPEFG